MEWHIGKSNPENQRYQLNRVLQEIDDHVRGGGSGPSTTDDLPEGVTNLYFTDERVDDRVAALAVAGTGMTVTYNDIAGTLTFSINATLDATGALAGTGSVNHFLRGNGTLSDSLDGGIGLGAAKPADTKLFVQWDNTSATRGCVFTQITDDGSPGLFALRKARGTVATPSAVLSGDTIYNFSFRTFGASTYGAVGSFRFTASENQTETARGANFDLRTVKNGSTSEVVRLFVSHDGNIGLNTSTQFGSGERVIGIANAATVPTTNPTGGGVLYAESGDLKYRHSSGVTYTLAPTASLTYFTEARNNTDLNVTVPVHYFTAAGSETNIDFGIMPKGTGAILCTVPVSFTASAGNKRGAYAVDFQRVRNSSGQVASGTNSVIMGGERNTSSGGWSTSSGYQCGASGNFSVAMGAVNTASGQYSTTFGQGSIASASHAFAGGDSASASGSFSFSYGYSIGNSGQASQAFGFIVSNSADYSMAVGSGTTIAATGDYSAAFGRSVTVNREYSFATGYGSQTDVIGQRAHSSALIGSLAGGSQSSDYVLAGQTTNATPLVLTTNNAAADTTNQVILRNDSALAVGGRIIARQNTTGDCKDWKFECTISRGANAASTTLVGAATVTAVNASAGAAAWAITVTADTTNGGLKIEATGEASKTIKWTCVVGAAQVLG